MQADLQTMAETNAALEKQLEKRHTYVTQVRWMQWPLRSCRHSLIPLSADQARPRQGFQLPCLMKLPARRKAFLYCICTIFAPGHQR